MNTFANTVAQIRGGDFQEEASKKLQELVGAVRETGRPGTITLTMKIKPATARGSMSTLIIDDKVVCKMPEVEKAQSLFFATDENTLQRNDPNQKELALKTVSMPAVEKEELRVASGQ